MTAKNVIKAIQTLYNGIQGGFVYWETKQDCTAWINPIDGLIWENQQFPKPTWDQLSPIIAQLDTQDEIDAQKSS